MRQPNFRKKFSSQNTRLLFRISLGYFLLIGMLAFACQPQQKPVSYHITDYGAVGDGKTLNTEAIQAAIDAATAAGGDTVIIPEGTFVSGTVYLKDGVTLFLEEGATLLGSPHLADYPMHELSTTRSYTERYTKKGLIYAEGVNNIAIIGKGTINGNSYAPEFRAASKEDMREKPLGIKLISCKGVRVEGVTIKQAGLWLQHYLNCEDLTIRNIRAFNHGNFTNDGMNIDGCRNVLIEDVYIDSHDDALVFKSTGPARCENVTVRNCELKSHCHALKFGTETTSGFSDFDISGIRIRPSDTLHYKTGKPWRVITGVALEMVDGGNMENIRISDLKADSVYAPIFIKLGNRARKHRDDAPEPAPGSIRNITLSNFEITDAGPFSSSVTGFPGHQVENVTLRDISITYNEAPKAEALFEEVPENEKRYPEITMFTKGLPEQKYLPTHGLFARHVNGLTIENFEVNTAEGEVREKFQFIDVENREIKDKEL